MSSEKLSTFFFDSKEIIDLRRQVQPYSPKEDLWSWYVLRRMSIYITLLFNKLKFSPNTVSWLSLFFVLLSGLCMVLATPTSFVLAFFSYNIGYLLDCVDGELARMTNRTSKLGYFIDMLIRAATLPVFISFIIAYLVLTDYLTVPNWGLILLYLTVISIVMSLLLPLSYDLTHAKMEQEDPVQNIRNKSILFEFTGFILGLPGFFVTVILMLLLSYYTVYSFVEYYLLFFIAILILKVFLRFVITVKTFSK
ncbi:CDP-alcohol phosphatidyltransferase family protein [Alkalihalobacillus sp. NPDC078783]